MTNFAANLKQLFEAQGLNQSQLAEKLGLNRTVLTKLIGAARPPTNDQRKRIARYFNVQQGELELDPTAFRDAHVHQASQSDLAFLAFRLTRQGLGQAENVVARYQGQYLLYYPQSHGDKVIVSLLSIFRATKEGIEATLINPHKDSSQQLSAYEYTGFVYPVRDFLYCFFEQKHHDYELLR